MAKFIIVLCVFVACAAAEPSLLAPLAYSAPLSAAAPFAYAAAPWPYANAHLDSAYASHRVDINENYRTAFLPHTFAAVAPLAATPLAAPVAGAIAPVAPLKYTAAHAVNAAPVLI